VLSSAAACDVAIRLAMGQPTTLWRAGRVSRKGRGDDSFTDQRARDPMNPSSVPLDELLPPAPPESLGFSIARLERLRKVMRRQIDEGKAPGVSMLIARHGRIAFRESIGSLKAGGAPMPDDAIFRIYSMTKPVVSVAAMTIFEEGRLQLYEAVEKYIPAFADMKVAIERDGALELVPARRPILIQDLMRQTSGLTYGFTGVSPVQKMTLAARILTQERTLEEQVGALAALPLRYHPGQAFEYGHSTDVLGRVLEIIEGQRLGDILEKRIFAPLGMRDTAFHTPPAKLARRAEPFSFKMLHDVDMDTIDCTAPPKADFAGSGLVSTVEDYARFAAMLSSGGALGSTRILAPRTLAYMTSDHIGAKIAGDNLFLAPGHGFGLGFAIRLEPGISATPGGVGEFFWGGMLGTHFWVAPRENLFAVFMIQTAENRDAVRLLFKSQVFAALE
jgi:CubicO group peptidase (beta-lactamase class C family)